MLSQISPSTSTVWKSLAFSDYCRGWVRCMVAWQRTLAPVAHSPRSPSTSSYPSSSSRAANACVLQVPWSRASWTFSVTNCEFSTLPAGPPFPWMQIVLSHLGNWGATSMGVFNHLPPTTRVNWNMWNLGWGGRCCAFPMLASNLGTHHFVMHAHGRMRVF